MRAKLAAVDSLQEIDDILGELDLDATYPGEGAEGPRGRGGTPKQPHLPENWLESEDLSEVERGALHLAEVESNGG